MNIFTILIFFFISTCLAPHQIGDSRGVVTTVYIRDANGVVFSSPTSKTDDYGRELPAQAGHVCSSLYKRQCDFLQGEIPRVERSKRPLTKKWLRERSVGDKVDALDYTGHWFTSEIVAKQLEKGKTQYKIHFDEWEDKWDEWIAWDSGRLQKHKSKAKGGRKAGGVTGTKYLIDNLPETEKDPIPPQKARPLVVTSPNPFQNKNKEKKKDEKKAGSKDAEKKKTTPTKIKKDNKKESTTTTTTTSSKSRTTTRTTTSSKSTTAKSNSSRKGGGGSGASKSTANKNATPIKKEKEFIQKDMERFLNMLAVGHQVDALDSFGYWYTARIIKVDNRNRLLIKFDDWEDKWNEWIDRFSGRIAKHKSIAKGGQFAGGVAKPRNKIYKDEL